MYLNTLYLFKNTIICDVFHFRYIYQKMEKLIFYKGIIIIKKKKRTELHLFHKFG